jgi:isoleucyl-tRNA synthetase
MESKLMIRNAAKLSAENSIEEQKKHFVEWGVMGERENAYYIIQPEYEAKQLQVLSSTLPFSNPHPTLHTHKLIQRTHSFSTT